MRLRRMLIGVGGDYLGKWLPVCVAMALPDVECRFVGQLWSNGHFVRLAGMAYRHWPWWAGAQDATASSAPDRNLTDFQARGLNWRQLPSSVLKAYAVTRGMIQREIEAFQPDALLYLTAETVMGHLMHQAAREKGLTAIGLQTLHVRDSVMVHTEGAHWWRALQAAVAGPEAHKAAVAVGDDADSTKTPEPSAAHEAKAVSMRLRRLNRIERAVRAMGGMVCLDTVQTLRRGGRMEGGFPPLGTKDVGEDPPEGLVLVALHRPVLSPEDPDWLALLSFALQVIPPDWPLVIRPHPQEPAADVPESMRQALSARGALISRPDRGARLPALLNKARLMLTLNSSLGVQALQAGVPVFTLAPAWYAQGGAAQLVQQGDQGRLGQALREGVLVPPDRAHVQAMLAKAAQLQVPMPAPAARPVLAKALAQRVRHLIEESAAHA